VENVVKLATSHNVVIIPFGGKFFFCFLCLLLRITGNDVEGVKPGVEMCRIDFLISVRFRFGF